MAAVLRDAEAYAEGGAQGLLLENFGDAPFFPDRVPAITVAAMTRLAVEVRRRFDLPLGINVLRNDGLAALAVASAAGACFIRVNVLCGARLTDQGVISGTAAKLLRERARIGAGVALLADVDVKHSAPLAPRSLEEEVRETLERGLADGLIVSGPATGQPPDVEHLAAVRAAAGESAVFVGSGAAPENVGAMLPHATGFIVGTSLKRDGLMSNSVDAARVREFVATLDSARR